MEDFDLYKDWSTTFNVKHIRKSIVNKYREGTMKSTQNKEVEIDSEINHLQAFGVFKRK